jgi:F0F1-type ATP synthase assembly protein I
MLLTTFLNWTPDMTASMIGYVEDLITDLSPLLIPIIAIGLGLIIFAVVVKVIRND